MLRRYMMVAVLSAQKRGGRFDTRVVVAFGDSDEGLYWTDDLTRKLLC